MKTAMFVLLLFASAAPLHAQVSWASEASLPWTPPTTSGMCGFCVAVSGDTVAALSADTHGTGAVDGVQIFERTPTGWASLGVIRAPGSASVVAMGHGLDMDADTIAVGAPALQRVYLITRTGHVWSNVGFVQPPQPPPPPSNGGHFGSAVGVRGDTLVVGAEGDDAYAMHAGTVRVFERVAGVWTPTAVIPPPTPTPSGGFGRAVGFDGTRIAVLSREPAVVHTFVRQGSAWILEATLTNAAAHQGLAVAIDGSLLVGGFNGIVILWNLAAGSWVFSGELSGSSSFGKAVAVRGDEVLIGEPDGLEGHAFLYRRSPLWNVHTTLANPAPSYFDSFGWGVALDGATAVVGAPGVDTFGSDAGAVDVYRLFGDVGTNACTGSSAPPCPCNNATLSVLAEGCRNSTGHGALMTGFGSASVVANDLSVAVRFVHANASILLFQGTSLSSGSSGIPFRDGVLCIGQPIVRLHTTQASSDGIATFGPGIAALGGWIAGQTYYLQAWHRDAAGPCGQGSNLTQALQVVAES